MSIECYRKILETADSEELREGAAWYEKANAMVHSFAVQNDITPQRAAGIIAVLSPMVEWSLNVRAAEEVIRKKSKARGVPGFSLNRKKALKVLHGDLSVIRGPKVEPFYQTLLDPNHGEPVLDTHMISAFYSDRTLPKNELVKVGQTKRREKLVEAIKILAGEKGWTVARTQATIWVTKKRLDGPFANQYKLFK